MVSDGKYLLPNVLFCGVATVVYRKVLCNIQYSCMTSTHYYVKYVFPFPSPREGKGKTYFSTQAIGQYGRNMFI